MNLALFDLDGTLTKKDSFVEFLLHTHGKLKFALGLFLLTPVLVLYKCGIIRNSRAKELTLAFFFKGWTMQQLQQKGDEFSKTRLPQLFRDIAKKQLKWHEQRGDTIVIVSASLEYWIKGWALANNYDVLATRLIDVNGKITGKLDGHNCYGQEKVNRVRDSYDLNKFSSIYAYGDSRGDKEMLQLADKKFYRWELQDD